MCACMRVFVQIGLPRARCGGCKPSSLVRQTLSCLVRAKFVCVRACRLGALVGWWEGERQWRPPARPAREQEILHMLWGSGGWAMLYVGHMVHTCLHLHIACAHRAVPTAGASELHCGCGGYARCRYDEFSDADIGPLHIFCTHLTPPSAAQCVPSCHAQPHALRSPPCDPLAHTPLVGRHPGQVPWQDAQRMGARARRPSS